MFAFAAAVYGLYMGSLMMPHFHTLKNKNALQLNESSAQNCGGDEVISSELNRCLSSGDDKAVVQLWERVKNMRDVSQIDLSSIIVSMQKLGTSSTHIVEELRQGLERCPQLISSVAALPAAALRDNAVETLAGILALLEEYGMIVEPSMYVSLMNAQLRRRDFESVFATAKMLPASAFTPRVRSMLALAAVHQERLDGALGQIRQIPVPLEDALCPLSSTCAARVLALAAQEQRVKSVAEELRRIRAKLEPKQLEHLVVFESRRRGEAGTGGAQRNSIVCRDLIDAGVMLKVPITSVVHQTYAIMLARTSDGAGLRALFEDIVSGREGSGTPCISEPLALGLLEACRGCKLRHDDHLVQEIVDFHRNSCAGVPGARALSAACSVLVTHKRFAEACDFYEREMVCHDISPNGALLNQLLKAAAQLGRSSLAQSLSDRVDASLTEVVACSDLSRHATMIKAYGRDHDFAGATNVFNRLRAEGPISVLIYNCYLDACVLCGNAAAALSLFEEMKTLELFDVVSYNTAIKAHLLRGCTDDARNLVKDMSMCGLQANKVTFNELLHAMVTAKDRQGMWSIIDEIHAVGMKADSVTCSILLRSLTVDSSPSDVKIVTDLIEEVEESIDEVLYSSVIDACIRIRHLGLLSDLLQRYKQGKCFTKLTAPTFGSMIKAYGQVNDIVRVRELWSEMEEGGVKPTAITLGCMVEALVANGEADEAWELVHQQLENEERISIINTVVYSTVLKGFANARRIDRVFQAYEEMRGKGVPCNTITYNTMLDACAKCCTMRRASGLLEDMKTSSVEPDIITYSTIIKGYCIEGDVTRAFEVLEDLKNDDKFSPDEIMYNSILDGCAKQHRFSDALYLYNDMKVSGVKPSNYTLSILVKVLGHARRLPQAFRMVDELSSEHGLQPNVQVYTCLLQACVINRRLDRALQVHDRIMADKGCLVDMKFYTVFLRGCLQLHMLSKAVEVVRAAYRLPGHNLALPSSETAASGVESGALRELFECLQSGDTAEQEALESLISDMRKHNFDFGEGGGNKEGGHKRGRGRSYRKHF